MPRAAPDPALLDEKETRVSAVSGVLEIDLGAIAANWRTLAQRAQSMGKFVIAHDPSRARREAVLWWITSHTTIITPAKLTATEAEQQQGQSVVAGQPGALVDAVEQVM